MKIDLETAIHAPRDIGFDFETTGLIWFREKPLYLGLANDTFSGYINLQEYSNETLSLFFRDFIKSHRIILQNAKYDFHFLDKYIPLNTEKDVTFTDVMLLNQIIDENKSHKLERMTELWIGPEYLVNKKKVDEYKKLHKLKSFADIPEELLAARGEEDARNTFTIYNILRPKLEEKEIYKLEKKLLLVLLRMERKGALINRNYLLELRKELEQKCEVLSNKYPNLNLSSSHQTGKYLFDTLGITPNTFTPTGKPKTDVGALASIDHPVARDIVEYRTLIHTISTYIEGFLDRMDSNDYLHCNFKQMGARTGRMSCVGPNLQQLPRKDSNLGKLIKSAFIGDITTFDYSQMEAIIYAYDSNEPELIYAIEHDIDLYQHLAEHLYKLDKIDKEQRGRCKELFLGRIYGLGKTKFKIMSKGLDRKASSDFFSRLDIKFKSIENELQTKGYIETIMGRRRRLKLSEAYKGLNSRIQGSSADIIKTAMVNLPFEIQDKMFLQVHDELVFSGLNEEDKQIIKKTMCNFKPYKLKVDSGSGNNLWEAFLDKERK